MSETARIVLLPKETTHRISRYVYGHFIEHLGGCIDDGIWVGEDSPVPNDGGIRVDTVAALKRICPPVVRWPGGLWADNYHWEDGIGPRDRRPIRQNLGWNRLEDNQFGTHEFMRFCEMIATEPYLCCNLGTGTVEEARNWAEYCNCAQDTTLSRRRTENGRSEPFNVKFWGLGNESMYALDGMMSAAHYADWVRHYAGYVKMFAAQANVPWDPQMHDVKTVLALAPHWLGPFSDALGEDANHVWDYLDLLAYHFYCGGELEPQADEYDKYVLFLKALDRLETDLTTYCDWARKLSRDHHSVDVAVDEWGLWRKEADHHLGLRQAALMSDALFAAAVLHIFHRDPKIYMANLAQTANVLQALVLTSDEALVLTPTYHVFEMLQSHQGATAVGTSVECSMLDLPDDRQRAALSVAATLAGDDNELFVSVVNLDWTKDVAASIDGAGQVIEMRQLTGSLADGNTFGTPNRIVPQTFEPPVANPLVFPASSVTTMRLSIAE